VEQFAQLPNSRSDMMDHTFGIRDRVNTDLRLVDEIATGKTPQERVSEAHVKKVLSFRRKRAHFFEATLFADPAWDILLELYAAELGQRRVAVTQIGLGSAIPATTTLRWLKTFETKGMIWRTADPMDGRRVFVTLTPDTVNALNRFFASMPAQVPLI